jgi:CHAT domain-containing protein/tetratricopeptide (TPR) repeat protein
MLPLLCTFAIAQLTAASSTLAGAPDEPRSIVREATRAVENDAAAQLRVRWQASLDRDPSDRRALLGLATLSRLTYDYRDAEVRYRRLSDPASAPEDGFATYARLGNAWALEERGFSNGAEAEFEAARKAAHAARDGAAEAEALIALSFVAGRVSGVPAGLGLLDRALRLIPEGSPDLHSHLLSHRAGLRGLLGAPEAMADAEASLAFARRAGDLRAEAQALRAAAKVHFYRSEYPPAVAYFRQAEERFRRARDISWLAVTITDRAGAHLSYGDFGEALEALRVGLAEAERSHNLFAIAGAHNGLADVAMHVNDLTTAREHLERSVAMYEAQGDPTSTTIPRRYLAFLSLAAGKTDEAKRQVNEVLEFYRSTQEATDVFDLHRMLAAISMREGDWGGASRELAVAEQLARRLRVQQWTDQLKLDRGLLALFRGDLTEAESSLEAYLATADATQPVVRHETRLRLAEIHALRGELGRAEQEAIAAWDDLERWRAGLGDRELRLLTFQTSPAELKTVGKSDQDASVARLLGLLAVGGRAASAFELAERRRARELMDALLQVEALRTGARAEGRPLQEFRATPVTADAIAATLPDEHTALLEFIVGNPEVPATVFLVQRTGLRAYPLEAPRAWSDQVARFNALLESGSDAGELAGSLGKSLLQPALAGLGPDVNRLVIVPDGPLHRLPWDALRLADGRHVVQHFSVSVAPSAAVVSTLWRRPREAGSRPMRLLAFGDPAFADLGEAQLPNDDAEVFRSAFKLTGGLPRLQASARESRLVAGYAPESEVRLREAASAAYLKRADLARFRILHFATHALVDESTAARTALALAPGEGESGFVGPGELAALRLDADLVVLSACRTARGVVVEGEGVLGLTSPFLEAGARSVVATSWRIRDQAAVAFVKSFYDSLAEGLPIADALRAAKLDALRRGISPSEWAVFTAVGDPLVRLPLRKPPLVDSGWMSLLLALPVLAAVAVAAYFIRMRRVRTVDAR